CLVGANTPASSVRALRPTSCAVGNGRCAAGTGPGTAHDGPAHRGPRGPELRRTCEPARRCCTPYAAGRLAAAAVPHHGGVLGTEPVAVTEYPASQHTVRLRAGCPGTPADMSTEVET